MSRICAALCLAMAVGACNCSGNAASGNGDGSVRAGDASRGRPDAEDLPPAPDTGVAESCGAASCPSGQVCRFDTCLAPPPSCSTDGDCENDTYCASGECIPYGIGPRGAFNPDCKRLEVISIFMPHSQCEWHGPPAGDPFPDHKNVMTTTLVANFGFSGNPETLHPSIVFMSYNCNDGECGEGSGAAPDGGMPTCFGVIRVVDGLTCQQQFNIPDAPGPTGLLGDVTPAIGDLDGDGVPDIVAMRQDAVGGGIAGFKYDAAAQRFAPLWTSYADFNGTGCHWDSLAIHDLDDDGIPEIVQAGPHPAAYDNQGRLIDGMTVDTSYSAMLHPVLADVDGDGMVEMVDGREAFRFDTATRHWTLVYPTTNELGQTALADFGTFGADPAQDDRGTLDGVPEVAVVSSGTVRVQTLSGRVVFGPVALPSNGGGSGTGGAPTVADFDGDGRAEIGVAGRDFYSVFDPDCVPGGSAGTCPTGATGGILWSQPSQDHSSSVTGSAVFDFDGDGQAEVVYADECFSRVYEGRSGEVLFSQFHTSCTWYENPTVADVDGDLRTEIVIPSNANCSVSCPALDPIDDGVRCDTGADCPGTTSCARESPTDKYGRCRCLASADCGAANLACADPIAGPSPQGQVCRAAHPAGAPLQGIVVMSDVLDRWVGSRPIWNQHAYAVTNVNDDGTIPRTSQWKANWKDPKLNNFRMNVQGALDPAKMPDLTSSQGDTALPCDAALTLTLQAKICNRGAGPVGAGVPVAFYAETKTPGGAICVAKTDKTLQPGDCEVVSCPWKGAPTQPTDVIVSADDDGTGAGTRSECEEKNNLATLSGVHCSQMPQ